MAGCRKGMAIRMTYMTFSQLKNSARARLRPVIGKLVGATAICYGLEALAGSSSSVSSAFVQSFALQTVWYFLFTVLAGTFAGMLGIGFRYMMLKVYCGRPINISDLFYPFTNQVKTGIAVSLIMSLISTIPTMPAYIFFLRFNMEFEKMNIAALSSPLNASAVTMPPEVMMLLAYALFCYTPAIIIITILQIIYSQVSYLMLDFPSGTVKQLFRDSRLLMRGHKGRYFYIQVSLIPITLIGGMFTCGIGMLWIAPFIYAVETEFYLDLVTKRRM